MFPFPHFSKLKFAKCHGVHDWSGSCHADVPSDPTQKTEFLVCSQKWEFLGLRGQGENKHFTIDRRSTVKWSFTHFLSQNVRSRIYALLSSNPPECQDWGKGGGIKPILAMPGFSRRLFRHSLPKRQERIAQLFRREI